MSTNHNSRPTTWGDRAAVALLMATTMFLGASCYYASPSRADDQGLSDAEAHWIASYGPAVVCATLDTEPTEDGVGGVAQHLTHNDGFTAQDATDIIAVSVLVFCPEHWPLVRVTGYNGTAAV